MSFGGVLTSPFISCVFALFPWKLTAVCLYQLYDRHQIDRFRSQLSFSPTAFDQLCNRHPGSLVISYLCLCFFLCDVFFFSLSCVSPFLISTLHPSPSFNCSPFFFFYTYQIHVHKLRHVKMLFSLSLSFVFSEGGVRLSATQPSPQQL